MMEVSCRRDKFSFIFSVFIALFGITHGFGDYNVLHAPGYMTYLHDSRTLFLGDVPSVIQTSFGFSTDQDIEWEGLAQQNPFKRPKAQVLFSVQEPDVSAASQIKHSKLGKLMSDMAEHHYAVTNNVGSLSTEDLTEHIKDATSRQSVLVDFSLQNALLEFQSAHPSLFGHLPNTINKIRAVFTSASSLPFNAGSLNATVKEDTVFLGQMYLINGVIDALLAKPDLAQDSFPDFYHFKVDAFKPLVEKYTADSPQIIDAEKILVTVITKVKTAMQELYGDNVVVQVLTYNIDQDEFTQYIPDNYWRSLKQADEPQTFQESINLSEGYHENYAVTFNIILWLLIVLAVVIYAVSYGIWYMDPGHDSIIYRMTSQRMKRD